LRLKQSICPGYVWEDPEGLHLIACGDFRDPGLLRGLLKRFGEEEFQLTLADPPYAVASEKQRIQLEGRKDQFLTEKWDLLTPEELRDLLVRLCLEVTRVTPAGNVWIWTSDWYVSELKWELKRLGLRVWPTYVWCKSNPPWQVRKSNPASACEFLVMASKKGNYFELDALPKQRNWFVASASGELDYSPAVSPYWVERPVVHAAERLRKVGEKEFLNRAQKPLDVTEALVRAGCPEGGLLLDLCGGTGTGLLAAERTGRRCVYVEKDPTQVRAAGRRLLEERRNG